ncbi:hypothetical protein PMAYCL1PPCAC_11298, partial [Pristionchus mayeri]
PAAAMSSSSSPSLPRPADADSEWIDAFCRAFSSQCRRLNLESPKKIDNSPALNQPPSWGSLPWPALNRLCFHLRTDEDCADLANLAQVSTHFRTGVKEFMKRDENRPGIEKLHTQEWCGLNLKIDLYPGNLPFHGPFERDYRRLRHLSPRFLKVPYAMDAPESLINQVSELLSSRIKDARIDVRQFTSAHFSFCAKMLRKSTFGYLEVHVERLDDTNVAHILSLASLTKKFKIVCEETPQLADPASFITQLTSKAKHSILRDRSSSLASSFFGLHHSFWKDFLNESLYYRSLDVIEIDSRGYIRDPYFILPDFPIHELMLYKQ